jgi:hypothetical protein
MKRLMSLLIAAAVSLGAVSMACEASVDGDGGEVEVDPDGNAE